ncbi:MAG: hypothetical protein A2289_02745 [Deltaproteobacteria bacterium RIFOXYA12_FULL_58_15]|nr:MAG: hypothetical protein A2289_02745 [Deltaproteobacteria bacterium RIFOXYA12_FULL_58_15]OGR13368.1 MAG: hypothetical protein A2341_16080 [Deltaproteobacteria bacterium RIFOXYB12_FULL_58_9]
MGKVGLFVCTGCDIGKAIDVDKLEAAGSEHGSVSFEKHECLCSEEGVALINKAIESGDVDGVALAACSNRYMVDTFKFDLSKISVERISLREQVAWTHPHGEEDTQMLGEDLVRMGVAKCSKMTLPVRLTEEVDTTVLVVGGGLAGLTAAKAASGLGNPVVLIEKADVLGGYLNGVKAAVPEVPPYDRIHDNPIAAAVREVQNDSNIKIYTGTTTKRIDGQPGQFAVELKNGEKFKVGSIVQATGGRPYDATKLGHLGYGQSPDVVTTQELEAQLMQGKLARPSNGKKPGRVLFVQCAGSRDENHLPYCSSECCAATLRQVATIHQKNPEVECAVVYRDLRAPGQLEHFYKGVQEQPNSLFTRGIVDKVTTLGGKLTVGIKESLLGDDLVLEADIVVLAVGTCPNSADGESIRKVVDSKKRIAANESESQVKAAQEILDQFSEHEGTEILNLTYRQGPDMPVLKYGFPDSHYICFPYETRRTGIYSAGAVHAPMDPAQAIEDGYGAAMKAVQVTNMAQRGEAVHPRAGDIGVAEFFLQRCTQCKRCTEECPFGTLNEDVKGTPEYNKLRCRRCGICLGSCPERIISFPDYSVDGIASAIKAMEIPEEDEEKPRMIAFLCENDAMPALDEAAARGFKWNPWIRVIPVRCLGAINTVWIADSLSSGLDGVLMIGCKHGDDYQCHYIRGSELCNTRMTNVQETLQRLSLEPERVQIHEIGRNDFEKIPEIFESFASTIDDVGANPFKGF